jgi:cobalamin-dependent methionine synthase I
MERLDPEPVKRLVAQCMQVGADFIDVNPGYLSRRKLDRMAFLVETVEAATSADLILDSPNPLVLKTGLQACQRAPILNALSQEEQKLREILPLAVEHQTRLVLLLMDERSFTPPSVEEKLALALELRDAAVTAGIPANDLIFDPVLPSLSWDDAYARIDADLKIIRLIASGAIFQEPADTMIGLSNLRSGMRRHVPFGLEATCMSLLAGAGVQYLLADVLQPGFANAFETVAKLVR